MTKFKNIFIVDDDKVFHFIIKKLLSKYGTNMVTSFYFNGLDALDGINEKIKSGYDLPDLILLDINMPIMDGWQFLDEFKKSNNATLEKTTIYLVSSSNSIYDAAKAKEYEDQITDYLTKPLSLKDLQKII